MTKAEIACIFQSIRAARNRHRAAERSADGFVSGFRVKNLRVAENELRDLLWQHRDLLIEATSEKI